MSDLPHFTLAANDLHKAYAQVLDKTAIEMGRTNSRDDRVDWSAINKKMVEWWKSKGYEFP
jgi:hypothetical protein